MKQAIVVRTDLKMGKGKLAAQCAHASIAAFLRASEIVRERWLGEGMAKVVLKVSSECELRKILSAAKRARLPAEMIIDRGLTQLEPGTPTAVGIGPAEDETVDKITGKLKLL
ncbi:MAG: peptidyl-tRNA hydrolase Pth2 [Candidatus Aenigmatarchaeota archaeon]